MTLFFFLKQWHDPLISLIGVLFCASLLPISMKNHYFQPWSYIEAWFFCAALLAVHQKRYILIFLITIIASLNRVTGIFIPFIYLLGAIDFKQEAGKNKILALHIIKFLLMLIVAIIVVITIRVTQGNADHIHSIYYLWEINTSRYNLFIALIHIVLFAGAGWLFALKGIRYSNRFILQEMFLMPLYLFPIIIFGVWLEVRLLMPLYPIILSLCLSYIEKRVFVVKQFEK